MSASDRTEIDNERFRASFDDALFPLWIMDLEGRYLDINCALAKMLGYEREFLIGAQHLDFVHSDERNQDEEELRLLREETREASLRETRLLRADGSAVWVAVGMATVRGTTTSAEYLVGQAFDVTARRQHEQRLMHLADHDPLTGLLNRRGFDRELRRHVSRIDRYGSKGSLLMLDLDDFKGYNDGHGHAAGDELLRRVATVLSGRLRAGDLVARIGGDEFAVLLPEANPQQAETVAAALVKAIGDYEYEGRHVTISIGVFSFASNESASENRAMVGADSAMYAAKRAGRNGYSPFDGHGSAPSDKAEELTETHLLAVPDRPPAL